MRKLFTLIFALALIFTFTGMALANGPVVDGDGGGYDGAHGGYHIKAKAFGAGCDADGTWIPNGGAFGVSGAIGKAKGGAGGYVEDGTVAGDISVTGGGVAGTDAYRLFHIPGTDRSIGVGSLSTTYAVTGADILVFADPNPWFGDAGTGGGFRGFAAQGTLNGSYVEESPFFFETTGFSGGIAGQGSIGFIGGRVYADDWGDCEYTPNSWVAAQADAKIEMWGSSYSESYRYVNYGLGSQTEGMGTNVGATTTIISPGYNIAWGQGVNNSGYANAYGGWTAVGFAATATVQNAPGIGGAGAYAVGSYSGSGPLNTNYTGSAIGYSATSVTTYTGMNGSINSASAGMSVTSVVH